MKLEPQILVDAAAVRGELRDVATAGIGVLLMLAIVWAITELRKL